MDRNEAEARIAGLLREIRGVVKEYGGTSGYLNLALYPRWDGSGSRLDIGFNNQYWPDGDDADRPLNFFEFEEEEKE